MGVGCSSSSSNTPATTPTPDAGAVSGSGLKACNTYCDAVGTHCADAGTGLDYSSAADCKTNECAQLSSAAACQAPDKAWFDCRAKPANLCGFVSCPTESDARPMTCP